MDIRSPLARLCLVLTLWGAGLAAAAQFAKISVIFDRVSALYPGAGAAEGFLLSLISLVGVLLGVVAGDVVARLGSRRVLVSSLALGAAAGALEALLPPLPVMLGLRLLEGLSHLGIVVAAPTLIAGLSEGRWQGAAMTLWGSFFGVSFALVAVLGVPVAERLGVPALFLAHAAAMLAFCLALWLMLPEIPRPATTEPLPGALAAHLAIWRSPWLSAPAAGWLFYTLTFVSVLAVLPRLMAPGDAAWAVTALPIAGIVLSLTLGTALLRAVSAVRVVLLGFAFAAVLSLGFPVFGASAPLALALFAVLGLVQGGSFAAVAQLNTRQGARALALGAMAQTGNLGNLLGTPLLLAAVSAFGLAGLAGFLLLAYLGGIAAHLWLSRRRAQAWEGARA